MSDWPVDLDALRDILAGRTLGELGDAPLRARLTTPRLRSGGHTLSADSGVDVLVLNHPSDKDSEAVFGENRHVAFDLQSAWVKYRLSAKVNGAADAGIASATGTSSIELFDYRRHDATDGAFDAVRDDLAAPRTLLDYSDVLRLAPGEALAMDVAATLSAEVPFSWSDALSSKLGEVVHGMPFDGGPLVVKLKRGLATSVGASISDHFKLVFSRAADGRFRIALEKARSHDHTFAIEVSAGAELTAIPAIDDAVESVLDALTRGARGEVEKLAAKKLRDSLRAEVRKRLANVARWKASAGLAYEYARIDEHRSIADFVVSGEVALEHAYRLALRGDFAALTSLLRLDTGSRTLLHYADESEKTRRSSIGFSLGLGKLEVSARERSSLQRITRTSLDGFHLVTFHGTRRYEEKNIPQNDFEWVVDLKAQMTEFREHPISRDFDCGLHYAVSLERARLGEHDVARMLDFASMWGICGPDAAQLDEVMGLPATIKVQLLFERDALVKTLAARHGAGSWAGPLAMAMPYASTFAERRTCDARLAAYQGGWQAWLDGEPEPERFLWMGARSGVRMFEARGLPGSFEWIIRDGHPHLRARIEDFERGCERLRRALGSDTSPDEIAGAYSGLEQMWSQRLAIAASGRWLLDRAEEAGAVVHRSLQIEARDITLTA